MIDKNSLLKSWISENDDWCTGFGCSPTYGNLRWAEIISIRLSKTDLFVKPDYLRIFYHGDYFHFSRTLGTDQRVNFIDFLNKASPILPESLVSQLRSFDPEALDGRLSTGSRMQGILSSASNFFRFPRAKLLDLFGETCHLYSVLRRIDWIVVRRYTMLFSSISPFYIYTYAADYSFPVFASINSVSC